MSSLVHQRQSLMFRSRSYMAFAITPQPPIMDWLADLDASLERSEGFFAGHPVALDLSAVNLSPTAIGHLVANLEERNIHILGIEGVDPAKWQVGLPPSFAAAEARGLPICPGSPAAAHPAAICAAPVAASPLRRSSRSIADDRGSGTLWAIRGLHRG